MNLKSRLPIPEDRLVFREVWIGGLSQDELFQSLKNQNIGINELGLSILNHKNFTTSPTRERLQTVEISVGDFGFSNGATTKEVYQKAKEFGLKLCPPELGPHIRLQYVDLNQLVDPLKGHWQNIAVDELFDDPGLTKGFYLRRRQDGFWLRGYQASPEYLWELHDRFIYLI